MSNQRLLVDQHFERAGEPSLFEAGPTNQSLHAENCWCDLAAHAPSGQAYNEQAFRYFLEIERKRSEVSGRPFLLLLIDLKRHSGSGVEGRIHGRTADQLFSALSLCLRETDFIGWYRQNRSIGAVLTQDSNAATAGISDPVAERVKLSLREILSPDVAPRLQLRIYQLPPLSLRRRT